MKKMIKIIKKYKMFFLGLLVVLILGIIGLTLLFHNQNDALLKYQNKNYIARYDKSWTIIQKEKNKIKLKHGSQANLTIDILTLEEDNRYLDVNDYIDTIIDDITKQNKEYKLIEKQEDNVTKNAYKGYKLLFESKDYQAMVVIAKKADQLLIFNYEAKSKYFDLILDSAQNIIYNFDTIEPKLSLATKIDLKTNKVVYKDNQDLEKLLDKTQEINVIDNNYNVTLSIPSIMHDFNMDTRWPDYIYEHEGDLTKDIHLYAAILNYNMYEQINPDSKYSTMYDYYDLIKDEDEYSDVKDYLEQTKISNRKAYIYKVSYKAQYITSKEYYTKERYEIIVELDNNHLLQIKLDATDIEIPKKFIAMLKIKKVKNYAKYIDSKIEGNYRIAYLKQYFNSTHDKILNIKLQLPKSYDEIDKGYGQNFNEKRNFGKDNTENMGYKIEMEYQIQSSIESAENLGKSNLESYNKRNNYNEFKYKEDINLNNKTFKLYEGGYNDHTEELFAEDRSEYYTDVKYLVYTDENVTLSILIKGKGVEVNQDILNELTNFEISIN